MTASCSSALFRAALGSLAVVALGARHLAERERVPVSLPTTHAPLPEHLAGIAALSFDSLVADVAWIRFLQLVPNRPDRELGRQLANQLRLAVELDPRFRSPYTRGAVLLTVLGAQPCAALEITEKAIHQFPGEWQLSFLAGYTCYFELGDAACGARHLQVAASNDESPDWLANLAARLLAESGQAEAAVEYLTQSIRLEKNPGVRDVLQERLKHAIFSRDVGILQAAVRTWRGQNPGIELASLGDLVTSHVLTAIPADPYGGEYRISPKGRVESSSGKQPLRAFKEPGVEDPEGLRTRVLARIEQNSGTPWLPSPVDRLRVRRDPLFTLQSLEQLVELEEEPQTLGQYYALEAAVILRIELDKLRATQLARLRANPRDSSDVAAIAGAAGLSEYDVFGREYEFADGLITQAPGSNPIVTFGSEGRHSGSTACR